MGKSISFFNPYSKEENQVTNYCGLMLKILYKESPEAFEKIINDFISNTGKSFECLPDFSQQKKKPGSIPDLCFSQKSFEIYFETKKTDWFHNDQIEKHIDGFDLEKRADTCILFLLTKEFNSDEESNYSVDYALKKGVILQKITFKDFLNALKSLIVENEYNLSKYFREYLEEFEEYLSNNEFLNDWQNLLDVINCRGTREEIEKGYYLCPNTKTYSHRRAKFFGAYWDKNVNYISEIRANVIVTNGEYSIAWKNTNETDVEIIAIAKDKISNCSDWRKEELENNEMQLFLLS
ncbi:MAG: hypothetical protein ACI4SH_04105, partial [Candidatus Scatosoma sp.]